MICKETRFDIGDASLSILTDEYGKEKLIVSFKTIYINKFTVQVIDLESNSTDHIHISDQLWESKAKSFLNRNSKEQLKLNQEGLSLIVLD